MDIKTLSPDEFPAQLREIPQVPKKLWLRGDLPPPEHKLLAVVGSRALSSYGRQACEILIEGLAGYPISIVSGLALGADACAHRAALRAGLHTVAVLGSGIANSSIGPRSNYGLAQEILTSGGAIISENEPDYLPLAYDFPKRNRIMVGLSHAVLVIEAGQQSGTLITAKYAGEYNRDLLCIPHRIGDPHGHAASIFLRLGAAYISEPAHIIEALHLEPRKEAGERGLPPMSANESMIYLALKVPRTRDELVRRVPLPAAEVVSSLMNLELKGLLTERFGHWQRI